MKLASILILTSSFLAMGCGGGAKNAAPAPVAPQAAHDQATAPADGVTSPQPASTTQTASAPAPAPAPAPTSAWDALPETQVTFVWSEKPVATQAPSAGAFVAIGPRAVKARHFEIDFDPKANEWRLQALADSQSEIGPTLTFSGKPAVGTVSQKMGANPAVFRMPADDGSITEVTADNARVVELTSITPPRGRGIDGHVSGRFVAVFKGAGGKQLWAAGTFTDAPYVQY
jgi:hypothetical protein